ncbi:MAG: Gfo/Idh/MocA family protein [Culicoidibacterales bacterium]
MKVAVIGLGAISPVHLQAIKELGATLVAVCDCDAAKIAAVSWAKNVEQQTDYRELSWEGIDAVHICTPHYTHYEISKYFLVKKINVLCEKPLTLEIMQLKELLSLARVNNCKYSVCLQNRCNESTAVLMDYIAKNGLPLGIKSNVLWSRGESYYQQGPWRGRYAQAGGGVLMTQALHTLDLLLLLCGRVRRVSKMSIASQYGDIESTMGLVLEFENGVRGIFYATVDYFADAPVEITLDYGAGKVYGFSEGAVKGDKTWAKAVWGNSHQQLICLFYEAIVNDYDQSAYISAQSSLDLHELVAEIYTVS